MALENADNVAASTTQTTDAITQLNEGDSHYYGNIGHDLVGFESATANTTPAQGTPMLRAAVNDVTVGTEDDSVTLPYAFHGRKITIINGSVANDLQIFPAKGDSINGAAVDAGVFLLNSATSFTSATLVAKNRTQWVVVSGSLSATS